MGLFDFLANKFPFINGAICNSLIKKIVKMKKLNLFLCGLIMVLTGCQNDKSIEFSGLKHTALGDAKIYVNKNLFVTNFIENRIDGVSIDLGKPLTWTSSFVFKNTNNTELAFEVLGNGLDNKATKSLSEIVFTFESNKISISSKFGAPNNDLKFYSNDSLVFELINFPSNTSFDTGNLRIGHGDGDNDGNLEGRPRIRFGQIHHNGGAYGACFWQLEARSFKLNNASGQVTGDRLIIAEHLEEGQSEEKMLFQKMNIMAGNGDTLIIRSEKIEI